MPGTRIWLTGASYGIGRTIAVARCGGDWRRFWMGHHA